MGLVLRPALGIAGAYFLWRMLTGIILVDPAAATAERLGLACAALLPGVLVLNLMIALQMLVRAWSRAIDPLAGVDNRFLQVNQRALTNTVEQLAGIRAGSHGACGRRAARRGCRAWWLWGLCSG